MQILEASALGLRSAKHTLKSPNSAATITLFPMVHVGDQEFFDQVYADAFNHDVALVEGVDAPVVRHLTASYRWIRFENLGLVIQPDYPSQDCVHARIVLADLTAEEFRTEWKRVPAWLRLAAYIISPVIGLRRRLFATRETLAEKMGMEDRLSRDEILSWDPDIAALQNGLIGARDTRLIEHLRTHLDAAPSNGIRLAIVFGANHMRAVLSELAGHNFYSAESEWQTVFSL